jgi:hypothetical protein
MEDELTSNTVAALGKGPGCCAVRPSARGMYTLPLSGGDAAEGEQPRVYQVWRGSNPRIYPFVSAMVARIGRL